MYLKHLELVGFKSFASKTRLQFEPGMTAIVGPNGCGKSNISDAVRWVLGEQSAKALRGSKMEDVIFNGTDQQKPLSLAEVSLTLADCEEALGTEYDEITITRRVLRSGEGQYFINKAPCRLKDIQRLFMDTGIGTNSYSLMEQGRIDLILSSRPEDRRAVFEEASGITKFKADKKEAIRKLDQTEANLLRLADIIREVKRRIISLQRQAGKAKRYKALQEELRGLDVYLSRHRLDALAAEVTALEQAVDALRHEDEAARANILEMERQVTDLRTRVQQKENAIAAAMEAASQAATERDRAQQTIQVNQDRIAELQQLSARDNRDAEEAQQRLETHRAHQAELETAWQAAIAERDATEQEVATHTEKLEQLDAEVDAARKQLNALRQESMEQEQRGSRLQNELSDLDARERNTVLRRERLSAEQAETKRGVERFAARKSEAEAQLTDLQAQVATHRARVEELQQARQAAQAEMHPLRTTLGDLQKQLAAREAQTELYREADPEADGFAGGARRLLNRETVIPDRPDGIRGALAENMQAEPGYEQAFEAVMRSWLDAVIVADGATLLEALRALQADTAGSARLLAADGAPPITNEAPTDLGEALVERVKVSDALRPLAARMLHGVRVVDDLSAMAWPLPAGVTACVTRTGELVRADGTGERWWPTADESNPLTRRHRLAQWSTEMEQLQAEVQRQEARIQAQREREEALEQDLTTARTAQEEARYTLSHCEGEYEVKAAEAKQAEERLETVTFELNALIEQQTSSGDRRTAIVQEIQDVRARQETLRQELGQWNERLHAVEEERGTWLSTVTEKRVQLGERRQRAAQLHAQREDLQLRMAELDSLIQERRQGVDSYEARVQELQQQVVTARNRLQPLEEEWQQHNAALTAARRDREDHTVALRHMDSQLHEKRSALDELRSRRSAKDVELAEQRMRRQNIVDRLAQEYRLTPEELEDQPDPEWPEGEAPDRETLETQIAEIRTKLESMGPVNLVAIEEHEELEERFQFLTEQQNDLIKAKQQLLDMIRRINQTTTEMFKRTFDQVNENFQQTFKQLFGGGSAKLVLVDDEEVLDSGIEIIARPPGKKLQSVSLLSGGERTMTAVGLLFALYMVKPSPFCVLDELDAALDDANINRFVQMVEGFVKRSQFIVITHNRQTIEAADALYGVTMEKFGISKIMSVRFHKHAIEHAAQSDASAPVPAATDGA